MIKKLLKLFINSNQWNIIVRLIRYRNFFKFPYVRIDLWVEIWDKKNKIIWKWSWIRKWVIIQDWPIKIWTNTNIWPYSTMFPVKWISIWNNVLIGPHVGIYTWTHITKNKKHKEKTKKWIIIEDHVWIWSHVVILDGIKIWEWTIIWAWTIVTKDTEKFSIIVWNPWKILYK